MTQEARKAIRAASASASASAAAAAVPMRLYEEARRRLLVNEPMRADARPGASAAALTVGEVDALESVGLSTAPWDLQPALDPLMRSIADYMALLDTSLTTAEAAQYLKVDVSRIRQRLRERSLFGIDYEGERRLPQFQFERKQVLPGLREVLNALPDALNALDVAEWFLSPNPDLEVSKPAAPLSPREWLLTGQSIDAVVKLAQGFE
jgi:hypothetical protein